MIFIFLLALLFAFEVGLRLMKGPVNKDCIYHAWEVNKEGDRLVCKICARIVGTDE